MKVAQCELGVAQLLNLSFGTTSRHVLGCLPEFYSGSEDLFLTAKLPLAAFPSSLPDRSFPRPLLIETMCAPTLSQTLLLEEPKPGQVICQRIR